MSTTQPQPGQRRYSVRFVHPISPSDRDVGEDVLLDDKAFSDRKVLGAELRRRGVMEAFGRVREFRVEGDRVVVFPKVPGYSTWHSIVLTVQPEPTPCGCVGVAP